MSLISSFRDSHLLHLAQTKTRRPGRRLLWWVTLGTITLSLSERVEARELWASDQGDDYVSLNSALKSVVLVGEPRDDTSPTSASNFWRGRATLDIGVDSWFEASLAYEQRIIISSAGGTAGQLLLPQSSSLPYQVKPLGNAIVDESNFSYLQAIDRAAITLRGEWGRAVIGRQAIGLGRSSFFTVVDVLAPFGTFQVDQEWKSGVDAFDIEWQLTPDWSFGFSEAAERNFSDAAFLARSSYNFGDADLLILAGQRSEDWLVAAASSWVLFDAAFYAELGSFFTDGSGVMDAQIGQDTVIKGTFGGSYTFDVLAGMTLAGEYHFNGFGMQNIERQQRELADPDYLRRFSRGDFQTLGQHELALSLNLTINEMVRSYGYAVVSGQDGSGLFSVGATMDASDAFSLDLSGFVPWGKNEADQGSIPSLESEYGSSPLTVYLSMRFYD